VKCIGLCKFVKPLPFTFTFVQEDVGCQFSFIFKREIISLWTSKHWRHYYFDEMLKWLMHKQFVHLKDLINIDLICI